MSIRLLYCGDVQTGPRALRDSGHEVVLLEPGASAAQLAAVAVQEDVDLVAVADPDLGADVVGALGDNVGRLLGHVGVGGLVTPPAPGLRCARGVPDARTSDVFRSLRTYNEQGLPSWT